SCDDGDLCTTTDSCSAGACVAGAPLDVDDGNLCTDDSCDPLTGAVYADNTAPCDDGSVCSTIDACSGGTCVGGAPLDVDDGNLCTDDSCDPVLGGVYVDNTVSCDDGNACTTADACSAGACVAGAPLGVDDGNVCTDDSCDPATGAVYVNNAASCEDGSACTTADSCSAGACVGGAPLVVDDGNVCTDDSCDPLVGAVYANNTASCEDGNACTTADTCSAGACASGAPLDVDDGNLCTDDSCDPAVGGVYVNNTVGCDDGDACTTADACIAGACAGGPGLDVDDGNLCTDDSCDPAVGAVYVDNSVGCDDGNACTTADTCSAGACAAGAPLDVDDGNLCTDDSCDPAVGAVYVDNAAPCDDGDACSTADACSAGSCVAGAPLDVDDGNDCTDDSCDPAIGAVYANNTAPCEDGTACTIGDSCSAGVCVAGAPLDVDDGNLCTDDSCDPVVGAVNANNTAACDDGDACTTADSCSGGACAAGSPLIVDDGNLCTDDSCDPLLGAVHADNTTACEDGDSCTSGDVCGGGVCTAGAYTCEIFACGDSLDNDGDDQMDYPFDPECASPDGESETGIPLAPTVDFTQMGDLETPVLYMTGLTVWADDPAGPVPNVVIVQSPDEFGGAGTSGGLDPVCLDENETISFDFSPGSVVGLSYRMNQDAPSDPAQPFSPYTLTVWGPDEGVTFSDTLQQVGTVDVSALAGGALIGGFAIGSESGYPIQISQLTYSVPPACSDGYDNDGDDLGDYPEDPECTSASADSETGTPLAPTEDFTQTGGGVYADLDLGSVLVLGSDSAGDPASLVLNDASDEYGGIGVQGGADDDFVEAGESVSFDFSPGRASNVSYRMHQVSSSLPEELFTPYLVTIWDSNGTTLYSQSIHQIGTVNVSVLVGNQPIGGFDIESQLGGNSIRISQINYDFELKLVDSLQLLSVGAEDGILRESKENSEVGGFANSSNTSTISLRAGDQKRDKQWMSVLSFATDSLPPGIEITRATVMLTLGRIKGDPLASLGDLLLDVQTGGFGTSTSLEKLDFEAVPTAPAAGLLFVDSVSAVGDLDVSGVAAINPSGVTQIRIRFEIGDNDNATVDYLGFFSGSGGDPSVYPVLEIEYEYWAP
ncbi:MAG: hypothetical protein JRG89_11740, partial [Deltaproteobacteria bacterium]|nr:hypothetical protein [Deltaproteobacteria bacterium]